MAKHFKLDNVSIPINTRHTNDNSLGKPLVPSSIEFVQHNKGFAREILLGVIKNMPVLLQGPTGCGKTSTVKWLAQQTNNAYLRVQLNGSADTDIFIGKWILQDESMQWIDGALTRAVRHGYWLLIDEINAALPEVLFALHQILDEKLLTLEEKDGEIVKPHPDFRVFAAMNPSSEYTGTKELNRALIDRFPIILNINYPETKIEKEIICLHSGLNKKLKGGFSSKPVIDRMLEFALKVRENYIAEEMLFNCSTRQLINWAQLIDSIGIKNAAKITILSKAEQEDEDKMKDILNSLFRDDENITISELNEAQKQKEQEEKEAKNALKQQALEQEEKESSIDEEVLEKEELLF